MLARGILLSSPGRKKSHLSTPGNYSGLLEFKRKTPSKGHGGTAIENPKLAEEGPKKRKFSFSK